MPARPAILAALALSAAAADDGDIQISQKNRRFDPTELTIRQGQRVRVLNDDRFIHHVYFETADAEYDSGDQRPGQSIVLEFPDIGTYEVRCAIHPKMRLDIEVAE